MSIEVTTLNVGALSNLSQFVEFPASTLANGKKVPSFSIARFLSGWDDESGLFLDPMRATLDEGSFSEAKKRARKAKARIIRESEYLAVATDICNVAQNWTGGVVGEGTIKSPKLADADEPPPLVDDPNWRDRMMVLSNGEPIFDFFGVSSTWAFDDVQGDVQGVICRPFGEESPTLKSCPYPSGEFGMGHFHRAPPDSSGYAILRGGSRSAISTAGPFRLLLTAPDQSIPFTAIRLVREN